MFGVGAVSEQGPATSLLPSYMHTPHEANTIFKFHKTIIYYYTARS
jgi:hypothetical protein